MRGVCSAWPRCPQPRTSPIPRSADILVRINISPTGPLYRVQDISRSTKPRTQGRFQGGLRRRSGPQLDGPERVMVMRTRMSALRAAGASVVMSGAAGQGNRTLHCFWQCTPAILRSGLSPPLPFTDPFPSQPCPLRYLRFLLWEIFPSNRFTQNFHTKETKKPLQAHMAPDLRI